MASDHFMAGMIVNRKKVLARPAADAGPGQQGRAVLEAAVVGAARELVAELADKVAIADAQHFASYFRRYAKQVVYDYVELQKAVSARRSADG